VTLYVLASALILALLAATCVAFARGLLGQFGVVRMAHCPSCDRFAMSWASTAEPGPCLRCRHERLAHPVHTLLHPRELAHH
jgi:hypothetical protein